MKKNKGPLEGQIQTAILEYLMIKGHFVYRNNSGGFTDKRGHYYRYGLAGSADIIGVEKGTGKFIAVEVKRAAGKTTEGQEKYLESVRSRGGIGIVARSVDDVIAAKL